MKRSWAERNNMSEVMTDLIEQFLNSRDDYHIKTRLNHLFIFLRLVESRLNR